MDDAESEGASAALLAGADSAVVDAAGSSVASVALLAGADSTVVDAVSSIELDIGIVDVEVVDVEVVESVSISSGWLRSALCVMFIVDGVDVILKVMMVFLKNGQPRLIWPSLPVS